MNYSKQIKIYKILKGISFFLFIITLFFIILKLFFSMFLVNVMSSEKYKINEPISFLMIGSDYRSDTTNPNFSGARADALIVATLNPNNSRGNIEANILSIPRDTMSYIPCGPTEDYYDKINSSLNYGLNENGDIQDGIDCTIEAVEFLMNIDIDNYVMATFEGIMNLVDGIGGIEIDSPYSFCTQDEDGNGYDESEYLIQQYGLSQTDIPCDQNALDAGAINFDKGIQTVDGQKALAYARQRHSSSDYERNIRQQQVITGIIKKVVKDPTQYADEFIKVFMNDFYTNITTNDLWNYINFSTSLFNNVYINLSNDVPVYIDIKNSDFENEQAYVSNGVLENTMEAVPMSDYYDVESLDNFEMDTYISRNYITKESAGAATNLLDESLDKVEENTTKLEPIIVELSSYSISSIPYAESSYTYFDFNTLYYSSNLLRKSYGLPVIDPLYDYTFVGIYGEQSYNSVTNFSSTTGDTSGLINDNTNDSINNEPEVIDENEYWNSELYSDDFSNVY